MAYYKKPDASVRVSSRAVTTARWSNNPAASASASAASGDVESGVKSLDGAKSSAALPVTAPQAFDDYYDDEEEDYVGFRPGKMVDTENEKLSSYMAFQQKNVRRGFMRKVFALLAVQVWSDSCWAVTRARDNLRLQCVCILFLLGVGVGVSVGPLWYRG